jgi:hypothetical protein
VQLASTTSNQLHLLRDRVTRRWNEWRALRWCARLATMPPAQFDAELLRGLPEACELDRGDTVDEAVTAAIEELTQSDQVLLGLLLQGSTSRVIGARMGTSEAQARTSAKALLCRLVNRIWCQPSI